MEMEIIDFGTTRLAVSSFAPGQRAETAARLASVTSGIDNCNICHTESGAPYIKGHEEIHISISHSSKHLAVATDASLPVGVDIETRRSVTLRRIAPRILTEEEMFCYYCNDEMLLRAWTLKECLIKVARLTLFDYRRDLRLPLNGLRARVFGQECEVLHSEMWHDEMLTLVRLLPRQHQP